VHTTQLWFAQIDMALTLESFGVSVAVNVLICLTVFLFFGWLRKTAFLEKFYAPKRCAFEHLLLVCLPIFKMLLSIQESRILLNTPRSCSLPYLFSIEIRGEAGPSIKY
jgi:hypothetical protein